MDKKAEINEEKKLTTGDIRNDKIAGPQERGSDNQYQLILKSFSNRKSTRNEPYGKKTLSLTIEMA